MSKKTPQVRVLFRRRFVRPRLLVLGVFLLLLLATFVVTFASTHTAIAATSSTINFQARLQTASGGIVADGYYNIQFKLYDVSGGGTALWTESWYDSNGVTAGNDNRLRVKNGYVTVNLGAQTSFPTINWDQDLWLTMNVGGTTQTATPTYDGEMSPRLKLTSVPYAFRAGELAKYNSGTGFTSLLQLQNATGGNQTFRILDQGAAGTYDLLTTNVASTGYIQNQNSSDQTANFRISGTGRANTALQTPLLDTASAGTLAIGTTNATAINLNQNTTIAAAKTLTVTSGATSLTGATSGDALTVSNSTSTGNIALFKDNSTTVATIADGGAVTLQNAANSTSAFRIQDSAGSNFLTADSTNKLITTLDHNVGSSSSISGAARLFSDSFESGNGALWYYGLTSNNGGTVTYDTATVRNGKYAAKFNFSSSLDYLATYFTPGSTVVMRGYINIASAGGDAVDFITINDGNSSHNLELFRDNSTGKLAFWNGNSNTVSLTSGTISTGTWYQIEAKVTISASTGTIDVYLDGTNVLSLTGQNTGSVNPSQSYLGSVSTGGRSGTWYADDISLDTVRPGSSANLNVADSLHVAGTSSFGQDLLAQGNVLFRNATNSTTSFRVQNAAGTSTILNVDTSNGRVGIGTAAPSNTLDVMATTSGSAYGITSYIASSGANTYPGAILGTLDDNATSNSTSGVKYAGRFVLNKNGSAADTGYNTGAGDFLSYINGGSTAEAWNISSRIQPASGATITRAVDFVADAQYGSAGAVTTRAGFYARDFNKTGTQTLGTQYGLLIESLTSGTNNYSILTGSAQSYFGGNVTMAGDTTIARSTSNNGTAFQVQASDASSLLNVDTTNKFVINNGVGNPDNLLENPGYESSATSWTNSGWANSGQHTIATDAANARSGNRVLTAAANSNILDSLSTKYYAVKPGDVFYLEGWVKTSGADGSGGIFLAEYDKDLANPNYDLTTIAAPGSTYTRVSETITVPSGKYYLAAATTVRNSSTTGTWYFDDLVLRKVNTAGPLTVQTTVNSATAFQIQNAAGTSNLLIADTTNTRIGIAKTSPSYTLDVAGDINSTTALRVGGTQVCTSSGCTVDPTSAIQNQNSSDQTANFRISGTGRANTALQAPLFDTASAGTLAIGTTNATAINLNQNTTIASAKTLTVTSGATSLTGASSGDALTVSNSTSTGNVAVFKDNATTVATIADGGAVTLQNAANSGSAFSVQRADGSALLNADTTNKFIINNGVGIADNLLQNPGFEAGVTTASASGWSFPGGYSIATDVTNARSGNKVLTAAASGANIDASTDKLMAVYPGDTYYFEGWVKSTAGANGTGGFYFEQMDKDKSNSTFTAVTGSYPAAPGTTYSRISGSITISSGKYYLSVAASVRNDSTTGTWYFDDLVLRKVNTTGPLTVQSTVNSTSAFQIQNAAGTSNLMVADTTNTRLGIGKASPAYTLDVNGDVNIASGSVYRINGTSICSATGCTPASGSANYIQNQIASQQSSSNFWISATGRADTSFLTPLVDTATATTLSVGTSTATGVTIGSTSSTGTITLGQSTGSNTVSIGSANPGSSSTQTINIGNGVQSTASSAINVNILSGAAGSNGTATLALGNNDRVTQIDLGNVAADAARTLNIGTGSNTVGIDTINVGTGATTVAGGKTIHIGDGTPTGSGTNLITIGSIAALANTTTIQGGNTSAAVTIQTAASGNINIGTNAVTGKVVNIGSVGSTANATTVNIANTSGNATQTVSIGSSGNTSNAITLEAGTGATAIQIGNGATAHGIQIGTGAAVQTLVVGSTNSTSTLTLQGGNSSTAVAINSAASGTVNVGNGGVANTVQVGNTTGAVSQTVNVGNNATASSTTILTLGSTIGASSTTTIQGGTGSQAVLIAPGTNGSFTAFVTGTGTANLQSANGTYVKSTTNNAVALQVQNAAAESLFNIDSSAGQLSIDKTKVRILGIAHPTNVTLSSQGTGGSLAAGTYYYGITAVAASGETDIVYSTPTSVTTSGSTSRNTLSWTDVSGETSYKVYRSTDAGATWYVNTIAAGTTSIIDNGSTYTWTTSASIAALSSNSSANLLMQTGTWLFMDSGAGNGQSGFNYVVGSNYLTMANYNSGGGIVIDGDYLSVRDTTGYHTNLSLSNTGAAVFANRTNSTTAFQIQNAGAGVLFIADTTNSRLYVGPTAGDATGVLLILGTRTASGDPTGLNGAIYYNEDSQQYRCFSSVSSTETDGAWAQCATNPIDRGFIVEDEFFGGSTGTGDGTSGIGMANWTIRTIGTACATLFYNGATAPPAADRPGVLRLQTSNTTNTGCTLALGNSVGGSVVLSVGNVVKTAVAPITNTGNNIIRVGLHNETTATTAPTTGVWWEANTATNANWLYCYTDGTPTATCAASGTAVTADTYVRLEIRVRALGSGTSAADFFINGTKSTVSTTTINTTNRVYPALTCYNTTAQRDCAIDYYQFRGTASAAR